MLTDYLPWSLRGVGPFLNTYGDPLLFRGIQRTAPIATNTEANTSVHSIVGHRFINAYLVAIKSFLRYFSDVAVYAHDDGTLSPADRKLIEAQIIGAQIYTRNEADRRFDAGMNDPFLSSVRKSYTSYLKLFDPTFIGNGKRIMLLDTDTLFIRRPDAIIDWACNGGTPWYHLAPTGDMKRGKASLPQVTEKHIQTLIMENIDDINRETGNNYTMRQGFCAGFVGYDVGTVDFGELKKLLQVLFEKFAGRIFRWGAEQTIHGLILCSKGARALPIEDYFVFTQNNAHLADQATFIHFVGENRFYRMYYPKLARKMTNELNACKQK